MSQFPQNMRQSDLPFQTLCSFFEVCARTKKPAAKVKHLRNFREKFIDRHTDDVYSIYRLILPSLDKERGHYGLKEANLVRVLIKACLLDPKTSSDAKRAENWRQAGVKNAGQFSSVMEEYLFRKSCGKHKGMPGEADMTVGDLNRLLDQLAGEAPGEERVAIFSHLIRVTTPEQMRWIVQIVLRDLKIGLSETSVLRDYHVDAVERYNVTCDFPAVIRELKDPHKRFPFQDITVGKPAKTQLARAVRGPEEAYNIMKGRPFVVETKFDGERMQVHVLKDEIRYYSRRGIEHGSYSSYTVLDKFIRKQLRETDLILDGEVVVWNKAKKKFEPFGGMKPAVLAARDNRNGNDLLEMNGWNGDVMTSDPDYEIPYVKDLELVFVVFDILYLRNQSVINRTLLERHDLLREVIEAAPKEGHPASSAMTGRMVPLLPGVPLLSGVPGSKLSHSLDDIQEKFEESLRINEEGIVVKAADSPWRCNDRGLSWLKIKADYVHNVEIDAVIIGARYGTGRRAGGVAEYLLALAEAPHGGAAEPSTFISFCMVGTGINDVERKMLSERLLQSNTVENVKGKNCAPRCYRITGQPKETPDVWVKDPSRSIVLQVQADVRTIVSKTFASRHSLRFPRVQRVRWDKSPLDIQTDRDLWQIVESNKGAIVGEGGHLETSPGGTRKKKAPKKGAPPTGQQRSRVVEQFMPADVSHIQKESNALKDALVYFVPAPHSAKYTKAQLEGMVKRLGGKVSQNYIPRVTHVIAQSSEDAFFRARKDKVDMISVDWLLECAEQRRAVTLRPHHYMHLTKATLSSVPDVCKYGDMYFEDVGAIDVRAILNHHAHLEAMDVDRLAETSYCDLAEGPQHEDAAVPSRRPDTKPGVEDILMAVDKELGERGMLEATSCLFRGCHLCMLRLPIPDANEDDGQGPALLSCAAAMRQSAIAAQRDLADLQAKRLELQVRLHGGAIEESVGLDTTHLVVLSAGADAPPRMEPLDLLQSISSQSGGTSALSILRQKLLAGQLHIVRQSWIDASLAALEKAVCGEVVRQASELTYKLHLSSSDYIDTQPADDSVWNVNMWPWEAFGVQTVVTPVSKGKRPRTTSPAESEEEAGRPPSASRAKRGRGRSMGAKSGGPRASRGKPRERAAPLAPSPGRTRTAGGRGRGRVRKAYVIGGSSSNDDEDMKDVQAPSLIGGQAQESGSDEDGTSPSSAKQRAPADPPRQEASLLEDLLSLPMPSLLDQLPPSAGNADPPGKEEDLARRAVPHAVHAADAAASRGAAPATDKAASVDDAVLKVEAPAPTAAAAAEQSADGRKVSLKERMRLHGLLKGKASP